MQGIDDDWLSEVRKNKPWERIRAVLGDLRKFGMENIQQVAKSYIGTCAIARGKIDQVDVVKEMGLVLKERWENGIVNVALVVRKHFHGTYNYLSNFC